MAQRNRLLNRLRNAVRNINLAVENLLANIPTQVGLGIVGALIVCCIVALCVIANGPTQVVPVEDKTTEERIAAEAGTLTEGGDAALLNSEENYINVQQTPDNSFLYDYSIADLVQADTSYQQNTVQVRGEVVGDPTRAEDGNKWWITLDSLVGESDASISVLISDDDLKLIDTYGGYNKMGSTLRVKGTFYVSCPSHEGIMDIHASTVVVTESGTTRTEAPDWLPLLPGALLCAIGILLTILYRILAERER